MWVGPPSECSIPDPRMREQKRIGHCDWEIGEGKRARAWGAPALAQQAVEQWPRMISLDAAWDSSHPSQLVFRTCVWSWQEDKTLLPHGSEGIVNCLNMTPFISPRFRSSGSENLLSLPLPPYAISSPHFACTGETFQLLLHFQPAGPTETSPREIKSPGQKSRTPSRTWSNPYPVPLLQLLHRDQPRTIFLHTEKLSCGVMWWSWKNAGWCPKRLEETYPPWASTSSSVEWGW